MFDGTAFRREPLDVLVDEGRLTVLPRTADPVGVRIVDLTGHTLTPGLIDAHMHMASGSSLTTFAEPHSLQFYRSAADLRATAGEWDHDRPGRRRCRSGRTGGSLLRTDRRPRLTVSLAIMSQTGGHGDGWLASGASHPLLGEHPGRPSGVADGLDEVRKTARRILRAGADHIKACATGGVRSIEHGIYLDDETMGLMLERGTYLVPTLQAPSRSSAPPRRAPFSPLAS